MLVCPDLGTVAAEGDVDVPAPPVQAAQPPRSGVIPDVVDAIAPAQIAPNKDTIEIRTAAVHAPVPGDAQPRPEMLARMVGAPPGEQALPADFTSPVVRQQGTELIDG